jgi:hypothetical protein
MSISGDEDVERQGLTEKPLPLTPPDVTTHDASVHPAFFIVYV